MRHSGAKDTQVRESSYQKVHPQPMEEATNQSPEAMEALVSRIFTNISSLKSAYIQLQAAHTPYYPDKIQAADKLVISELKNLSELKHFYREHNPKPVCVSPQDSRLAAEIQEQQSLLKTYEVMVKNFQSEIQNKDSEIVQLEQQIQDSSQKRVKLEKNLKLRGLSTKESEGSHGEMGQFSVDLSPELFISAVEAASRAIHDFSKPLINMMKAAGWDLDAAAIPLNQTLYNQAETKESLYQEYLSLREMDPLDAVGQNPDSMFGKFCQRKYLDVVHQRWKHHFLGNEFSEVYMDSVVKDFVVEDGDEKPKVGVMVMPGFWIGGSIIQSQVYLTVVADL
ncbi:hypothetical protein SASPL_130688 [Salvia splendens]|uniref:DUF641 domain-containing protein n=1 Tax=Salvia splendens TaxID=180675 RepID=A0A8X8X653_SALSN|nr:hypothetical protein SASPL_130688 [Salvia splendens]